MKRGIADERYLLSIFVVIARVSPVILRIHYSHPIYKFRRERCNNWRSRKKNSDNFGLHYQFWFHPPPICHTLWTIRPNLLLSPLNSSYSICSRCLLLLNRCLQLNFLYLNTLIWLYQFRIIVNSLCMFTLI